VGQSHATLGLLPQAFRLRHDRPCSPLLESLTARRMSALPHLMSSRYQAITGAWIEFRCRR
jgi:hypothetical protein